MKRNLSGWGVTIAGLLLAAAGAVAMWTGWDMIVIERGWSLFIAGAVAVSGGVVTVALGRVVGALGRLAEPAAITAAAAAPVTEEAATPAGRPAEPAMTAAVAPPPIAHAAQTAAPAPVVAASVIAPPAPEPVAPPPPPPPVEEPPEMAALRQKLGYSRGGRPRFSERAPAPEAVKPEPTEVDRYTAGESTYVMMSDGSVVVHSPEGVQRYASLAVLKAETALQSR
jgi:hypothetical protein